MKQLQLNLLNLSVYHQTEADGDELFLKLNGRKIWPIKERYYSIRNVEKVILNYSLEVPFSHGVFKFELWEYDNPFSSMYLGSFNLRTDQNGGPFTTDLMVNSRVFAKYSIEWSLMEKFIKINI